VRLIEVAPAKKVAWAFRDWTALAPASSTQLLDEERVQEKNPVAAGGPTGALRSFQLRPEVGVMAIAICNLGSVFCYDNVVQTSYSETGFDDSVKNASACRLPRDAVPAWCAVNARQPESRSDNLIKSSGSTLRLRMPPNRITILAFGRQTLAAFCHTFRIWRT